MDSLGLLHPTSSSPIAAASKTPTASYVECLCTRVVECISTRSWDDTIFEHFTPGFQAFVEHSDKPLVRSAEEYIDLYKRKAEDNPRYRGEVLNASADVNKEKGKATVWLLIRIHGDPEDVIRESVTIAFVRRRKGKWWFEKQIGMRGIQFGD